MPELDIREVDGALIFPVKVVSASSTTRFSGLYDRMIKVKVSAAPEKGKANTSLVKFLAGRLGVKKSDMTIVSGHATALKQIRVTGISAHTLLQKLARGGALD